MSNLHLPAELLDHVVDYLHDTQDTLRNCCLVSKSWVPRARKHLFADIGFPTEESVRSWKETFPDPSTSPAHYTQNLSVSCNADTASDAEASGWIGGFSRVVRLELGSQKLWASVSFTPFHGLSLVVKSLHVIVFHLPSSPIFDLILSFPLLEDLVVIVREVSASDGGGLGGNELLTAAQRSSRPTFTGSLELYLFEGMEPIARRLLSLPGGLHFRKLALTLLRGEDLLMMVELVEECSHTLESLKITSRIHNGLRPASIDLSKTTKLKDIVFGLNTWRVGWITTALQTITPKHRDLRQITIEMSYHFAFPTHPANLKQAIEENRGQWLDLDRLLVQFWESRSVQLKVCAMGRGVIGHVGLLLPEVTGRGIIDLVEH